MTSPVLNQLKVPSGMPVSRFRARPVVEVPSSGEVPLIDGATAPEKRIQEVWNAKVKVFNLAEPDQLVAYEKVWQAVCDGRAIVSEHKTEFHNGCYVALLRWADLEYKLPTQV